MGGVRRRGKGALGDGDGEHGRAGQDKGRGQCSDVIVELTLPVLLGYPRCSLMQHSHSF